MEINDIKIFYEVAKLKSTSKAATKLGYVQSNISKRITRLEVELEKKLFVRSNKGMKLTEDGESLLFYAKEILSISANMQKKILVDKERIRIGATQTILKNYLNKYYLREDILLFTKSINGLIKLLKDSTIDFLIVNRELFDIELEEGDAILESICWVKSKMNKLNFDENKIIVSRDKECPYRIETFKYIKNNKLNDMRIIEVDTMDILIGMIETNEAIAILPKKIIDCNYNIEVVNIVNDFNIIKIHVYKLLNNSNKFNLELI